MSIAVSTASASPRAWPFQLRTIGYWAFTLIIALEMVAGSFWDLLRVEYVRVIMTHLGYPLYVLPIIGAWKLPGALTMLAPRFPRLKEWAYAGAIFNYWGATASHLLAGDGPARWAGPLVFAGFTLASWALRPPSRRLQPSENATPVSGREWVMPALIAIVMIVVALLTLPKGPPPGY